MNTDFYNQLQNQAEQIASEAVKILARHEHDFTIAAQKDEVDIATNADLEVEQFIRTEVKKHYPDHGFLGEEFGEENVTNTYVWIIDPLDNTKEYVRGIGEYNCLIAVEEKGVLVAGVTHRMGHEVRYAASRGNGAFCDGKKIHVSSTATLAPAFIGSNCTNRKSHTPKQVHSYLSLFESLINSVYRLRFASDDAKSLGLVAQGAYDGFISLPHTDKWVDIASGILLVEEAGGKVTNWNGEPIKHHDLSNGLLATNGMVHEQVLTILKKEVYGTS